MGAQGLDLSLRNVACDESLPAYISEGDISWKCGEEETSCTMGETVEISGGTYTDYDSSGYASANLQILSLQYELFQLLPFNFCGDWVQNSNGYSNGTCPNDGQYRFDLTYQLPPDDDQTSWFASGWTATSEITIFSSRSDSASILADCKLEFHTSVTHSSQKSAWRSLPSAATVTLSLIGVALFMCMIICCLACRKTKKRATARDFNEFRKMRDDDGTTSSKESLNMARKIARKMRYGEPGVPDWA
eukprot:scaffold2830_cov131-Cylindrotheca_fusiformis.AAC.70